MDVYLMPCAMLLLWPKVIRSNGDSKKNQRKSTGNSWRTSWNENKSKATFVAFLFVATNKLRNLGISHFMIWTYVSM